MGERITRYIRADLQKDQTGQLFVKGNLDVLDVMDQIAQEREYFSNFTNMMGSDLLKLSSFSSLGKRDFASVQAEMDKYNREGVAGTANTVTALSGELMNPELINSEKSFNKTYITKEIFEDMGWQIDDADVASLIMQ